MARCPCSDDEAHDIMRSGCGIAVSGSGIPQDPRHLDPVGGDCVCAIMRGCIHDKFCGGLSGDDGCLGVKLSRDGGNTLKFGTDGGLYGDCPTTDPVVRCVARVDQLPAFVCGGMWGAGANISQPGILDSYTLAVSLDLDMAMVRTVRTCDGQWVTAPSGSLAIGLYETSVAAPGTLTGGVNRLTHNQINALRLKVPAGYGVCQQPCGLDPLTGILRATRDRMPISIELPWSGRTTIPTIDTANELRDLLANNCGSNRAIVHVEGPSTDEERQALAVLRAAGYETGVFVDTVAQAAIHTPAKLAAEGVKWAYLNRILLPDATISAYVAAGLQVLLTRCVTPGDRARAVTLGCRGVLCDDPPYVCGPRCQSARDTWCQPAIPSGQLALEAFHTGAGSASLGQRVAEGCGWEMPAGTATAASNVVLLGWFDVGPDPTNWVVEYEARIAGVAGHAQSEVGMLVCGPDDAPPLAPPYTTPLDTLDPALTSGYLMRMKPGSLTFPGALTVTTLTRGQPPSAPVVVSTRVAPADGTWVKFRITVTPTQVRYAMYDPDNPTTTPWSVMVANTAHRGRYVWAYKRNAGDVTPLVMTSYRNLVRVSPA